MEFASCNVCHAQSTCAACLIHGFTFAQHLPLYTGLTPVRYDNGALRVPEHPSARHNSPNVPYGTWSSNTAAILRISAGCRWCTATNGL